MINSCAAIVIAAKHGELIKVKDASGITNTIGALRCKFEFRTTDWDYTARTAVFCKGNMTTQPDIVETAIGVLLDNVDECAVPPEVLLPTEKYFSVGVWGVTKEGLRIVSKWLVFRIEDGCYVNSGESIMPTPTVYEQIIAELGLKASKQHEHDDRYYTKPEIDEKILVGGTGSSGNVTGDTYTKTEINELLKTKENISNKTTVVDEYSDDEHYPTAKAVYTAGMDMTQFAIDYADDHSYSKAYINDFYYERKEVDGKFDDEKTYVDNQLKTKADKSNTYTKNEIDDMIVTGSDGEDGVSCTHEWNGTVLTITSASGTSSADLKGERGEKGEQGPQGKQGEQGPQGESGADGVSCTHSWNGTILSVTSASGTTSADLKGEKGEQGEPGAKGDKGEAGQNGANGVDGYTPKRGTDYWTDADKAEIKSYVDEAILGGAW